MRLLSVFRKSLREQGRDLWLLVLTLITAPAFVLVYWAWFGGGSSSYTVLVLNQDRGAVLAEGTLLQAGADLQGSLLSVTYAGGKSILMAREVSDRTRAEATLANRDAALLLIIPEDFSEVLRDARSRSGSVSDRTRPPDGALAELTFVGDLTSAAYTVAAVITGGVIDEFVQEITFSNRPVGLVEEPLGASGVRTEFETYVPGLLVVAVVMAIFTTAMAVAREVETGALRRLRLTGMTSFDLLAGVSLTQVLIGTASVLVTFFTAWALGFRSQGPLWVAVLVGAVTTLSIVGAGLVVAAFSRGVVEAFVIGNFPLIFFLFFSGAAFPMPRIPLFTVAGRVFGVYDFVPASHAVVALNKVLALGAGLGDVIYELSALVALSAVYFAIGVFLFRRKHLRLG
jgi:ABC-2 type transport system permease protein